MTASRTADLCSFLLSTSHNKCYYGSLSRKLTYVCLFVGFIHRYISSYHRSLRTGFEITRF